jgi:CBS domain containing-hemolysin-like protein
MEDIIETLLGREIMDETDTVKDMQALARSKDQKNIN